MLQRLAKIINQFLQLSKDTAVNRPVDTAYPPTSAIDQQQQTVDGSQTTIAGDVRTKGGMVNTGDINTNGGGVAGGAGSKAAGSGSVVAETIQGDIIQIDHAQKIYIEAVYTQAPLHTIGRIAEEVKALISENFAAQKGDFALGLYYLERRHYRKAVKVFGKAHNSSQFSGKPLYYGTLARCGTWRQKPSQMNRRTVQDMEEDLSLATKAEDSQAHYWYLWALIIHEYYKRNDLLMNPSVLEDLQMDTSVLEDLQMDTSAINIVINELLSKGNELFVASTNKEALLGEIRQMQKHVKDTDRFIDTHILNSI